MAIALPGKTVRLKNWLRRFRRDQGKRARPLALGATGHLLLSSAEEDHVADHLERGLLPKLAGADANGRLIILTGLAPGADLLLMHVAERWLTRRGIEHEVVGLLPIPPDRLLRDWQEKANSAGARNDDDSFARAEAELQRALQACDVLVDLMDHADVGGKLDDPAFRQLQYRRLGALLAEQTDVLVAVLRKDSEGLPGGTAEVVEWRRNPQSVPPELSTLSVEQRVAGERPKQLVVLDPAVPFQSASGLPPDAVERVRKQAHDAMKAGNYLQCYDIISRARARGVDSRDLQYLTVLALANAGSTRLALRRYVEFEEVGDLAEDWLALKARLLKDLAFRGSSTSDQLFLEAAESYEAAYRNTGGHFSGINAASMYCLAGKRTAALKLAAEVSAILRKLKVEGDEESYYWHVTQAEAALLLDDMDAAREALRRADRYQVGNVNSRSRTRFQLKQVAACLGHDGTFADLLALPPVMYVRRLGATSSETSPESRAAIAERLAIMKPLVFLPLLGLPELRAAEICIELGVPLYVSLADERSAEVARWRRIYGEEAVERLARCLMRAHEVCSARGFVDGEEPWCARYVESMAFGLSLLAARRLATNWKVLGIGDTGRMVGMLDQPPPTDALTATGEFNQTSAPTRRRYVGLIFADFVGFSALSDENLPRYWGEVMDAMAQMLKGHAGQILFRHTWGDAPHIVTRNASSAASIATDIRATLERVRGELTGDLSRLELRLSAHYAPAFIGHDPIEGIDTYYGTQLSFAARIEPVTPPGAIFVTESFAARLMLEGAEHFVLEYAGELELAKNFGQYRLFSLRKRTLPDFGKTAELLFRGMSR
ncbi:MAG TPA: adenylate/guanylate cyclase domain-containing protein [Nevskiaceae bacterium]|nr:adenylate/guanylate cyclase domain-containing protein [Nevskiaceae bacterium]